MTADAKALKFVELVHRVVACTKCPRMAGSARVLGPGCGPLNAPLVFVGEAPGRLGADGSHLPFHGDKSGHNFEKLIEQVGISRYDVFVTNAVLCNPKDERGNNGTPSPLEIANCAPFLRETLELVDPMVVVTLGAVALKACSLLEPHSMSLRENVRKAHVWMNRTLIPAYHPGQRAMIHRSFANQLSDYQYVAEILRRQGKPQRKVSSSKPRRDAAKLGLVVRRILEGQPEGLSYFALHKLCFLAELASLEATGERMTNAYVVRQKDGPYFVDLHSAKLPQLIVGVQLRSERGRLMLALPSQLVLDDGVALPISTLSLSDRMAVDSVSEKYRHLSDAELKRVVYLSRVMRDLLRQEKATGANLYNAAVLPFKTRA